MTAFLVSRLLNALLAIIGALAVVFILLHASGSPAELLLPPQASESARAAFNQAYGLDKPLPVQFGLYLVQAFKGNFGDSFRQGEPALGVVLRRLPATILLTSVSVAFSFVVGILAGIFAALKRGSVLDQLAMIGTVMGQSMPGFWLGLLLIWLFAVTWTILPPSGFDNPLSLILPAVTLSPWLAALTARLMRSSMLEVLHSDYVRTAHAKGVSLNTIVLRHVLRNAIMPTLTMTGISFAYYMGGAVIVEYVFGWPGVGNLMIESIGWRDYPIVMAIVALVATTFVLINLLVDVLHGVIDPRCRSEELV
jgi:peptide/nickel transport system permease protein